MATAEAVGILAPNPGFVDFDWALQSLSVGTDHRRAEFVEPGPGRLVAPQAKYLLKGVSAGSVLLAGHQPDRLEPESERLARVLKDGPGGDRGLVTAGGTLHQAAAPNGPPLFTY